ncbi:hypothetical protein K440DRAFT_643241 [Wilcoxina mikolae CBS 423.85]|nr:hypothetical protein K440DRAFT_643241 [Wilcoxina mikolae CBS 423.85]
MIAANSNPTQSIRYILLVYIGCRLDWWMNNRGECTGLGFAQCFLKYNGYGGWTCDVISQDSCGPLDTGKTQWDSIQQFYTIWNIYCTVYLNLAITDLQTDMFSDTPILQPIFHSPRQRASSGTIGKEFLATQAFKVIFIGMSAIAGGESQMAVYLASQGGTNYEALSAKIIDVQSKLSEMVQTYQGGIANMIKTVQGDPVKFLQLCSAGGFSQRIPASLPDQQKTILDQLKLYILSMSLRLSGNVISASPNTNVMDVAKTTKKVKCPGFDSYGACNQWWYDSATDTTYALTSLTGDGRDSLSSLTHAIFDNGWATPQTLFTADPSCSLANPSLDDNMNVNCLSSVQKCTAANTAFKPRSEKPAEFTNCPSSNFWLQFMGAGREGYYVCSPCSYLGPEITAREMVPGLYKWHSIAVPSGKLILANYLIYGLRNDMSTPR